MELDDCAFPLLARGRHQRRSERRRSTACNVALLVGARPRTKGMERADLLEANGGIFKPSGRGDQRRRGRRRAGARGRQPGEHERADRDEQRAGRAARALHRDDAARPQPRDRAARQARRVRGARRRQHDDLGQPLGHAVPRPLQREGDRRRPARRRGRRPRVAGSTTSSRPCGKRGAAIIEARGASSAASAANAAIDHVHDWVHGTPEGDWVSMAVPSDGSYGVRGGPHLRLPVHATSGGEWYDRRGTRRRRLLARARSTRRWPSSQQERDAVKLELI